MGRGAALGSDKRQQAPRLTSVLRALATEAGGQFDVDTQFVRRSQLLQARRQERQHGQDPGTGHTQLAKQMLGSWDKAPKAARDDYETFLQAVRRLIGGEPPSEEVAEAALLAWSVLQSAPPPEQVRGHPGQLVLKPIRDALAAALGRVQEEAVGEVVALTPKLQQWQSQLAPDAAKAPSSSDGLLLVEFGSELQLNELGVSGGWAAKLPGLQGGASAGAVPQSGLDFQQLQSLFGPSRSTSAQLPTNSSTGAGKFSLYNDVAEQEEEEEDEFAKKRTAKVDLNWLDRWCRRSPVAQTPEELALAVCRLLLISRSGDAMAAELYELLGDSALEQIGELVENRKALTEAVQAAIGKLREEDDVDQTAAMPSYGTSVTISSESAKLAAKLERKDRRRQQQGGRGPARPAASDLDLDYLMGMSWDVLLETERDTSGVISFGHGVEFRIGAPGAGLMTRGALPKGTTRHNFKGWEEVRVPARTPATPPTDDELVKIRELPDWAQLAFEGYKTLNRIQSRIFGAAFNSNENLLVCAPTGAGKTNIAMIAVLREIGTNMAYGVIQKADFKVVYVAPMKALAAEVTASFSKRLAPLGVIVRELTGDMQLSKKEMAETQMIVTTPEKWDVITRKGGDVGVAALVKLLIIDEVHLLNDDRGPVIETLVARTLRQVEASQAMIRIVGLSATLPNYEDVAQFLRVSPETGLFHFDASFRPVPLEMQFVGVSERNFTLRNNLMAEIAYNKIIDSLRRGYQCMVFVHSRKDTGKTANALADLFGKNVEGNLLDSSEHPMHGLMAKEVRKSRNRELAELFDRGFGIHHAGMLRPDRTLTEKLFAEGLVKVLCCTATLAWGVNLPAHTVIIKGTQVYDAQKGTFTDLGMLDVQQIFGRAGRPQFDTSGEGIIITTHDKLAHYLGMLTHSIPIESQFKNMLVDNLNAEIVLGTVSNVREAVRWLSYTYLYTRMGKNPLSYGITYEELLSDPSLESYKRSLITGAANQLKASQMAVFDEKSGNLYVTELGRVASHFYIRSQSIITFNELMKPHMSSAELLSMVSQSNEFEQMMVRDEELPELEKILRDCPESVKGGIENKHGKVNTLMQAYVSRARVESFSLTADMMYAATNGPRIMRAVFEIALRRKWCSLAETALTLCKALERRVWPHQHPLRQMDGVINAELLMRLEERNLTMDRLYDMEAAEIGSLLRHPAMGSHVKDYVNSFPSLALEATLQPITRTVLRIQLTIRPTFTWKDRMHGGVLRWLVWVEDSNNEHIYHSEMWLLSKRMMAEPEHRLAFTIPIFEPLPPQYFIRAINDSWLNAEAMLEVSFASLILPERMPPHTELLDLDPLPVSALQNPAYQSLYTRFTHFNPIQTQAFHTLYHTDENVLLGAPTGSGKTISAELTMLRVFTEHPGQKVVYIAPLKALVRERMEDWGKSLCPTLGKRMVELTGDYTPDLKALQAADIIIATPEKWDGISRQWQTRSYVKHVALIVIDEIHLLGADRGPTLEVIVSRMRYISAQTERNVRFVGLSTALANAQDLADWLGISQRGLFNFKPSVRPVPLEVHIQGYPGKFYCPRMATMNKPSYAAIQIHSPTKPVLVFVSSRRQTRLTALDLITYAVADERPHQFVHMSEDEVEAMMAGVKDPALRHTLQFGIGLHHAGLNERDRQLVERLYVEMKIQILVATSTLAWGVNTPAHLVIIKGTEFYDAPTKGYVDYPITDVLQMMGRAGRPQYDRHGVAVIMVHEPKKQFYKRFLYEPFPVESSLPEQVSDHLNAEVVAGTISSRQDAVDYLTWTYFFRRLVQNPSYYDLADTSAEAINEYMSGLVERALGDLLEAGCVAVDEDGAVSATTPGRICSYFYLQHRTMATFAREMRNDLTLPDLLKVLCSVAEYDELPLRHNEDKINLELAREVRYAIDTRTVDDPHTKAQLLLQSHLGRVPPPISDYATDTKSALDQSLRVLQAMVDVAADAGWLATTLSTMNLVQCILQARWIDESSLLTLPGMSYEAAEALDAAGLGSLPQLVEMLTAQGPAKRRQAEALLVAQLGQDLAVECMQVCERLPVVGVSWGDPRRVQERSDREEGAEASGSGREMWAVEVQVTRLRGGRGSGPPRVYAPRYPKVKEEGWWLVLGDTSTRELLALKRLSLGASCTARLQFPATNGAGQALEGVTVFLVSDSYIGFDQQYWMPLQPGAQPGTTQELQGSRGRAGAGRGRPGPDPGGSRPGWAQMRDAQDAAAMGGEDADESATLGNGGSTVAGPAPGDENGGGMAGAAPQRQGGSRAGRQRGQHGGGTGALQRDEVNDEPCG